MDVMLDLESLGTLPDTVILTFGAVKFNPYTDEIYGDKSMYVRISVDEQLDLGRTVNQDTIDWWGRQDPEVFEEAMGTENRISVEQFTQDLNRFLVGVDNIWAQGPAFDIVILENLYRQVGKPIPWQFWQVRDSRTLFSTFGDPRDPNRGQAHNALADCIYQAQGVQQIFSQQGVKPRMR